MAQKSESLEVDLLNMKPIPGSSLTEEPGKRPYERPPQIVGVDQALSYCLDGLLGNQDVREELFNVLDAGLSVETVVSGFVLNAFTEGVFTPDVAELIKTPLIQFIAQAAGREGIEDLNVLNEDIPKSSIGEDKFSIMRALNPKKFDRITNEENNELEEEAPEMEMDDMPMMQQGFINQ